MDDDALPPLLTSLLAAIQDRPDDVPLRLHVAELLIEHGLAARALTHCAAALERDPGNARAVALVARATSLLTGRQPPAAREQTPATKAPAAPDATTVFDWGAAEAQVADLVEPAFVGGDQPAPADAVERGSPGSVDTLIGLILLCSASLLAAM
jgi:hypothetical protein